MSIWTNTIKRSNSEVYRKEDAFMTFKTISHEGVSLSKEEKAKLYGVDKKKINLHPFKNFEELHNKIVVELKKKGPVRDQKVTYLRSDIEERIEKLNNIKGNENDCHSLRELINYLQGILDEMGEKDQLTKTESYTVLGEYVRVTNDDGSTGQKIILYMDTIRASSNPLFLLAEVYVHELHHAYFDHDLTIANNHVKEVEEPLTELGMLLFMEQFDLDIFEDALMRTGNKKYGLASCYGFGAYLYDNLSERNKNWVGLMYDAKYKINKANDLYGEYCLNFKDASYPVDEKHCAGLLNRILFETTAEKMTYLFSKDLTKTVFTFGVNVNNGSAKTNLCSAFGKTMVLGDPSEIIQIECKSQSFNGRWSVVNSKGHLYGVMRITWKKNNSVETLLKSTYPDLYYSSVIKSKKTNLYLCATEVHFYFNEDKHIEFI